LLEPVAAGALVTGASAVAAAASATTSSYFLTIMLRSSILELFNKTAVSTDEAII